MITLSMRKVTAIASATSAAFFALVSTALAQVPVQINPPAAGINPATGVGTVLTNILTIIFVVATLAVLVMLIIGAFNWITSGGDKEKVGAAQKRITQALAGFVVLALAFLIVTVVGRIININVLDLKAIPTLDQKCGEGLVFDPEKGTKGECVPARK
jgi:hypothetical protein